MCGDRKSTLARRRAYADTSAFEDRVATAGGDRESPPGRTFAIGRGIGRPGTAPRRPAEAEHAHDSVTVVVVEPPPEQWDVLSGSGLLGNRPRTTSDRPGGVPRSAW
jgi:hypothetical protein